MSDKKTTEKFVKSKLEDGYKNVFCQTAFDEDGVCVEVVFCDGDSFHNPVMYILKNGVMRWNRYL